MNDYSLPYPSRRAPVLARNMVATSQPLAAQAGLSILQRGGNAIDAALATAIALTVVEPTGCGVGSDAFAIVCDGERLHGLNASGRSPAAWTPERFPDGVPERGWESVSVPGAVSGWVALSERFGALPFEELFAPAIGYARDGFPVSPHVAELWSLAEAQLGGYEEFRRAFLPAGRAPRAGEIFTLPELAETLETIAASRGEEFYRGALAKAIVADARRHGAALAEADLEDHQAEWVDLLSVDFRGAELHEIPPNGQGLAALIALGILEHLPIDEHGPDSAAGLHLQIEAMKVGLADAYRYVGDGGALEFDVRLLLGERYLAERANSISPDSVGRPEYGRPAAADTVYLCSADDSGRMVSFIQSNYRGFGSGIVVPRTGISLQNRGSGFVVEAGHPNRVAGGKRPFHTIIPGFLTRGGSPLMSFGVMGGPMQAQGHVQMVLRTALYGQNPQAACDAPRWQVLEGGRVALEGGFAPEVVAGLQERGHRLERAVGERSWAFGGAQLIWRLPDAFVGASDSRKDGQVVGF